MNRLIDYIRFYKISLKLQNNVTAGYYCYVYEITKHKTKYIFKLNVRVYLCNMTQGVLFWHQ